MVKIIGKGRDRCIVRITVYGTVNGEVGIIVRGTVRSMMRITQVKVYL